MRQRRTSIPAVRRHPALAAVALVAMAPMVPMVTGAASDDGAGSGASDGPEPIDAMFLEFVEDEEQGQVDEFAPVEEVAPASDVDGDVDGDDGSGGPIDEDVEEPVDDPVEDPVDDEVDGVGGECPSEVGDQGSDVGEVVESCDDEERTDDEVSADDSSADDGSGDGSADDGTAGDESGDVEAGDDEAGDEEAGDDEGDDEEAGDDGTADVETGDDEVAEDRPEHDEAVDEATPPSAEVDGPDAEVPTVDAPATVTGDAPAAQRIGSPDRLGSTGDAVTEADDDLRDDEDHRGLRAERYDGVYAQGVPVWVAMTATRYLESRDNYDAQARGSTASGAYQVIDSTWNNYGGYRRAVDAPPAVQDQFAYESMVAILKRHGNKVSAIPLAWYYPAALHNERLMDIVPVPQAGNILTPRQYQARWMMIFNQHLENGSPVFLPADTDPLIPAIAFPVLGPTSFWDDWHADRDGGLRKHEGLDFMGENGQPLRAAFDGVVTRIRPTNTGRPGVGITITREDGLRANYFHLDAELRWHPDLDVGDSVKAGQVIAYMGDTGNAGVPHLHFELRTEEGEPIAPYPAALEAVQREQCSVGIGPWSTAFRSPEQEAARLEAELQAAAAAGVPAGLADVVAVEARMVEVSGPDGARWTIGTDGSVTAEGVGALVAPGQGACGQVPTGVFGTGAAGLSLDLLPEGWWGDEVEPADLAAMIEAVESERSGEFDDPTAAWRLDGNGLLASSIVPI